MAGTTVYSNLLFFTAH